MLGVSYMYIGLRVIETSYMLYTIKSWLSCIAIYNVHARGWEYMGVIYTMAVIYLGYKPNQDINISSRGFNCIFVL